MFDLGFVWRREWDSNPRYACDVHTISNRAPSASSDISPRGFILLSCPFPSDACLLYDTFFVFASTFNIYSPYFGALFTPILLLKKSLRQKPEFLFRKKSKDFIYILYFFRISVKTDRPLYTSFGFLSRPIDRPPIPFSGKIVTIFFRFDT